MTSGELAAFWKLPPHVEILDVMGSEGLAANLFRITATDAKLKRDQVIDEDTAILTHLVNEVKSDQVFRRRMINRREE